MKIFLLFFSLTTFAQTRTFLFSPWISDCTSGECTLPAPSEEPKKITLDIAIPDIPGQSSFQKVSLPFQNIEANFSIFYIKPSATSSFPPYYQLKLEIIKPDYSVCATSPKDMEILPPLICGLKNEQKIYGITISELSREP